MMTTQTRLQNMPLIEDVLAALSIDDLKILIPHHEVNTLEAVADVETVQSQDGVVGYFTARSITVPIYCFSSNLTVLDKIPPIRRIAVLLTADTGTFAILCDRLKIIPRKQLLTYPLPYCMQVPRTPISGLAISEDKVFCMSSANQMLNYLRKEPPPPNLMSFS